MPAGINDILRIKTILNFVKYLGTRASKGYNVSNGVSHEKLLNAAKCQVYSFYLFYLLL